MRTSRVTGFTVTLTPSKRVVTLFCHAYATEALASNALFVDSVITTHIALTNADKTRPNTRNVIIIMTAHLPSLTVEPA